MTAQQVQSAEINDRLSTGLALLKKRKFGGALEECEAALKLDPGHALALALKRMVQERKELYIRGGVSIVTGFVLMWLMTNLTSDGQATLTNLGFFVLGMGVFLWLEGVVVALSGVRAAYLIDGLAVIGVGIATLGVAAVSGGALFGVVGVAQIVWGGLGIRTYLRQPGISYRQVTDEIKGLARSAAAPSKSAPPEALKQLDAASRAYEKGKNRKDVLLAVDAVLQQAPTLAEAHNLRGMALEDLNQPGDAAAAYREALRLDPSFYVASDNLTDLETRLQKMAD